MISTFPSLLFCMASAKSSQFSIFLLSYEIIWSLAWSPALKAGDASVPSKQSPKTSTSVGRQEITCLISFVAAGIPIAVNEAAKNTKAKKKRAEAEAEAKKAQEEASA